MKNKDRARLRLVVFHVLFLFLVLLSSRRYFLTNNWLWTDEGRMFSWKMKLTSKACDYSISFDKKEWFNIKYFELSDSQINKLTDPCHFLKYVKLAYCPNRQEVYARQICKTVSHDWAPLVSDQENFCKLKCNLLSHNYWILEKQGKEISGL